MKATEKQHNAPPMPAHRFAATQSIAKHFQAIGISGIAKSPQAQADAARHRAKVASRKSEAVQNPPHSRQEAKARAAEALARHREEKGVLAPPAKKYEHASRPAKHGLSTLALWLQKLPKAHNAQRIDFAQRMYADRSATLHRNLRAPLSSLRGHVASYDPRPKGMDRCELYFPQRGAVPVGY